MEYLKCVCNIYVGHSISNLSSACLMLVLLISFHIFLNQSNVEIFKIKSVYPIIVKFDLRTYDNLLARESDKGKTKILLNLMPFAKWAFYLKSDIHFFFDMSCIVLKLSMRVDIFYKFKKCYQIRGILCTFPLTLLWKWLKVKT